MRSFLYAAIGSLLFSCTKQFSTKQGNNKQPTSPAGLTAIARSTTQIKLSWKDSSANEDGFKIERRTAFGTFAELAKVDTDVSTYTDTGLNKNTIYTYRVCAYNSFGRSPSYTNEASASTWDDAPAKAINLTAIGVSYGEIKLMWEDVATNETGYKVERKDANGSFSVIATLGANLTSYNDKTLAENTLYTYRILAFNVFGNGDYSNEASERTPPDISTGLVAFFPFTGNAGDSSGNNNHGTVNGATLTTDRFNNPLSSYSFNGTSDHIRLPLLSSLDNIEKASFSFWVQNITTSGGAIIGHWGNNGGVVGANAGFVVGHYNGLIITDNYAGCCSPMSNLLNNTSNWNHIAIVFDGTKINAERVKFYINGVESTQITGTVSPTIGKATSSFIGMRNVDNDRFGDYFGGNLDEVRIYSRPLTSAQINYLATH